MTDPSDEAATNPAAPRPPAVAMICDYPPRRCGVAIYADELLAAMAKTSPASAFVRVAVIDPPDERADGAEADFEIRQHVASDYLLAADFLNARQPRVVCVQHEYGLYGGKRGSHLLTLLRRLRPPSVVTLHTVLQQPDPSQREVLRAICRFAWRVVTMSHSAARVLQEVYAVPPGKIRTIPRAVPDPLPEARDDHKDALGLAGRPVLLSLGLLSPDKGIEYAIEAMPRIIQDHPDVAYVILGATHPTVRRAAGEEYRNRLHRRIEELGLSRHVMLHNRFVSATDWLQYVAAADVCLTPYLQPSQATSGVIAAAMAAARPVVSTRFQYAREMLADDRGVLVDFRDADAIASAVHELLVDETRRSAMGAGAREFCRAFTWSSTAQAYWQLLAEAPAQAVPTRPAVALTPPAALLGSGHRELPEIDLRHLRVLTDDTGIFQHCTHATPDRHHGYCTDDVTRALIVAAMYSDQTRDGSVNDLLHVYLSFLAHAMNQERGRFRNFMSYDRSWMEEVGSDDSHGRALWGLGVAAALCPHESMIAVASSRFLEGLEATERFHHARSQAFTLVGIQAYLLRFPDAPQPLRVRELLAAKLARSFERNMTDDWPWLEDIVTYANAKLSQALISCGDAMGRDDWVQMGLRSLDWLCGIQTNDSGMLSIIGNHGWLVRPGRRARFDQQCIEAHALVEAAIHAYRATRDPRWVDEAWKAFTWFLGDNDTRSPLVDFTTGGCRDGLEPGGVNQNQGAESTLAWLMSLLLMQQLHDELVIEREAGVADAALPVPGPIRSTGPIA